MAEKVNVKQLRDNLASYIDMAEQGREVVVTSHGREVAKLVPATEIRPRAEFFGAMAGKIIIAEDFDETPAEVVAAMEGAEDEE